MVEGGSSPLDPPRENHMAWLAWAAGFSVRRIKMSSSFCLHEAQSSPALEINFQMPKDGLDIWVYQENPLAITFSITFWVYQSRFGTIAKQDHRDRGFWDFREKNWGTRTHFGLCYCDGHFSQPRDFCTSEFSALDGMRISLMPFFFARKGIDNHLVVTMPPGETYKQRVKFTRDFEFPSHSRDFDAS